MGELSLERWNTLSTISRFIKLRLDWALMATQRSTWGDPEIGKTIGIQMPHLLGSAAFLFHVTPKVLSNKIRSHAADVIGATHTTKHCHGSIRSMFTMTWIHLSHCQ